MARIIEIAHDESIGKTLMLLTQTARVINRYVDSYFYKKAKISFTKFMVLKLLASTNGVMTQTDIAEYTQTVLHNITTLVARLKKEDLISTKRSDLDKRSVNVSLTDKGRMVLSQAMPIARELIDQIMSSITETDALKLGQILEVLRGNAYGGLERIAKDA
ncbi:MarR family winged helix-turn-helix transcriptional regulator [Chloroflexota bacterium]